MEDCKPQMSPEDASINYMFQVCLLAFMRNADQPNFHDSLSLFDSLAVRAQSPSGLSDFHFSPSEIREELISDSDLHSATQRLRIRA
jgi:hypothetical protein